VDAWRAAWNNDLRRGGLENGVFIGSPGRHSVEPARARLSGEVRENKRVTEKRNSGMTEGGE
jgi:hypothetical protein